MVNGFIYLNYNLGTVDEDFAYYYKYLTPMNVSGNPWFKPLWEYYYKCKWDGPDSDLFLDRDLASGDSGSGDSNEGPGSGGGPNIGPSSVGGPSAGPGSGGGGPNAGPTSAGGGRPNSGPGSGWNPIADPASDCQSVAHKPYPYFPVSRYVNRYYDGVYIYALALQDLIKDKCPKAFGDKSKLRGCIDGKTLLSYMKKTSYSGLSGEIQFNADGDMLAQYTFYQYIFKNNKNYHNKIGTWRKDGAGLQLEEELIDWSVLYEDMESDRPLVGTPESVCSKPCHVRQFPVQQEVSKQIKPGKKLNALQGKCKKILVNYDAIWWMFWN